MRAASVLFCAFGCAAQAISAESWISVKVGPFVFYSDASPKEMRERAAEWEQTRFSLGQLLGQPDLTFHPPLQIFLTRDPGFTPGWTQTRTGGVAFVSRNSKPDPENRAQLIHLLLQENVGRMPPNLEKGLERFLSTTEVIGAKVVWGAPPAPSLRDADWALIHWLITNPETFGKVRVLLKNLENNVDEGVAFRNALGKGPEDVAREVQTYLQAGSFRTIDAPSRPLSPDRDLPVRTVDPEDMNVHLADLLNADSERRYRAAIAAGVHRAESEEGLAMLALRRKDVTGAAELLRQAAAHGSKNAAALVEYARLEPDEAKARAALETAIAADPNAAEAHFLLGQKLTDASPRIEQWKLAAKLAPRKQEYWVALAQSLVEQKKWSEAAKAWRGAEQAASTPEEREKMLAARVAIEGQRLDYEEAERQRAQRKKEEEIARLKAQALAEVRAAEARVNGKSSPELTANAVPWWDENGTDGHAEGRMVRIECSGHAMRFVIRLADSQLLKLSGDPAKITVTNANGATLACGPQKERTVSVAYQTRKAARGEVVGTLVSLEFR